MATFAVAAFLNVGIANADEASIEAGRNVFQTAAGVGCKTCHGDYGEGDLGVGPYIRGATDGTIRAAIDGINEMIIIKNTIAEEDIGCCCVSGTSGNVAGCPHLVQARPIYSRDNGNTPRQRFAVGYQEFRSRGSDISE